MFEDRNKDIYTAVICMIARKGNLIGSCIRCFTMHRDKHAAVRQFGIWAFKTLAKDRDAAKIPLWNICISFFF